MQLAAGTEHVIAGKAVRVNLAGPRPELPLLFLDPSQTQPMLIPQSAGMQPPHHLPAPHGTGVYFPGLDTSAALSMIAHLLFSMIPTCSGGVSAQLCPGMCRACAGRSVCLVLPCSILVLAIRSAAAMHGQYMRTHEHG